jgi:hypothetical protein
LADQSDQMQIRLLDFRGFDELLDIPEQCTVAQLRDLIATRFNYSMQTSAIWHRGEVLDPHRDLPPDDIASDNTFVLFNERLFPVKSYPTVDRAFRFFPTRYQEFYSNFARAEDSEHRLANSPFRNLRLSDFHDFAASGGGSLRDFNIFLESRPRASAVDFPAIRDPALPALPPASFLFGAARGGSVFGLLAPVAMRERAGEIPDHMIPPGVDLTGDERAAVMRLLRSTRIDLHTIIQVFCACERNEAAAERCLIAMAEPISFSNRKTRTESRSAFQTRVASIDRHERGGCGEHLLLIMRWS